MVGIGVAHPSLLVPPDGLSILGAAHCGSSWRVVAPRAELHRAGAGGDRAWFAITSRSSHVKSFQCRVLRHGGSRLAESGAVSRGRRRRTESRGRSEHHDRDRRVFSSTEACVPCRHSYRGWAEFAAWVAIVHVPPHSRQRQNVVTVIVFARVSMILPVQKGHLVGRMTSSLSGDPNILDVFPDFHYRATHRSRRAGVN